MASLPVVSGATIALSAGLTVTSATTVASGGTLDVGVLHGAMDFKRHLNPHS